MARNSRSHDRCDGSLGEGTETTDSETEADKSEAWEMMAHVLAGLRDTFHDSSKEQPEIGSISVGFTGIELAHLSILCRGVV